jgi:hypothetical protein
MPTFFRQRNKPETATGPLHFSSYKMVQNKNSATVIKAFRKKFPNVPSQSK